MNWTSAVIDGFDKLRGGGGGVAAPTDGGSFVLQHLHNLAPNTFPQPPSSTPLAFGNVTTRSPVIDAVAYMRAASMEMLSLHDSNIPVCLRDMYKMFLRSNQHERSRAMSVVFTMMHQSRSRLTFYKDIAQLASGVVTSHVPRLLPLDRGVRGADIGLHDVFNDMTYRTQQAGGDIFAANNIAIRPENPYLRMLRGMILETLREFAGNTDKRLFKENQTYDDTDSALLIDYVQSSAPNEILSQSESRSTNTGDSRPTTSLKATDDASPTIGRYHDVPATPTTISVALSPQERPVADSPAPTTAGNELSSDEQQQQQLRQTDIENHPVHHSATELSRHLPSGGGGDRVDSSQFAQENNAPDRRARGASNGVPPAVGGSPKRSNDDDDDDGYDYADSDIIASLVQPPYIANTAVVSAGTDTVTYPFTDSVDAATTVDNIGSDITATIRGEMEKRLQRRDVAGRRDGSDSNDGFEGRGNDLIDRRGTDDSFVRRKTDATSSLRRWKRIRRDGESDRDSESNSEFSDVDDRG